MTPKPTPPVFAYRFGKPADAAAIAAAIAPDFKTPHHAYFEFDPAGVMAWYASFIPPIGKGAMLLAEHATSGELCGGLAVSIVKWPWSKGDVMTDAGFFVVPHCRGTKIAINLLKWAKYLALERHRVPLVIAQTSGYAPLKMDALMQRHGLERIGATYYAKPDQRTTH